MTSKRDFGPLLGAAGAIAIAAAVIAGFIVVGGPGDARAQRFDAMTMDRVNTTIVAARCAMTFSGSAPPTRQEIVSRLRANPKAVEACGYPDLARVEAADDIEYSALDASRIRVCAEFRRPRTENQTGDFYVAPEFPELAAARPSGRHCYELTLRPMETWEPVPVTPASPPATAEPVPPPPQ